MVSFNKVLASVYFTILWTSIATALPYPVTSKYATHSTRKIHADFSLKTYHPASSYETFGDGIDHPLSKRADAMIEDSAIAFIQAHAGVDSDAVHFRSKFIGESSSVVYFKQKVNGLPVANAVANVAFNKENKVASFGSSFVKPRETAVPTPSVSIKDAIATAQRQLNGEYNAGKFPEPQLEYVAKDDDSLVLTHSFQAFVDAHSGELVSVVDFVAKASYLAIPIDRQSPLDGFETIIDPQDPVASPNGWHNDGIQSTLTTAGNNVIAYKDLSIFVTSQSSPDLVFDYPFDLTTAPNTSANADAVRVNAFYVGNMMHDMLYRYGFTEAGFNFQTSNFARGGDGLDRVLISVQEALGTDNAFFATPPDGQSGMMHMFLFDATDPMRDGALQNDIVAHEFTHGLTNRLTGGGTARCLTSQEALGMGEGWSDAMADWLHQTNATVEDFVTGAWVTNSTAGGRSHPYSTSAARNPLRYSSVQTLSEVHDIGEVWANMLHNVYAALVGAHGFAADARAHPESTAGNAVWLHLFVDALSLQPCNPTMPGARDAWLQADVNRYGGANKCVLWKAFASRGLGVNAKDYVDDSTVPTGC
ncbi:Fungalysin metallopeptidase-domain-containing protein [Daedaleopsis nitida]|nr:Fungalysin metallopeptidase-domain-containing protein [Daedaleopsis nitida]